jgi:hypothetical protein
LTPPVPILSRAAWSGGIRRFRESKVARATSEEIMRTLMGAASLVVLGLSPWILPSIAVAAKITHEEARNACRSEFGQNRSGDRGNARTDGRSRNQRALRECIQAKLAGKKWP